MIISKIKFCLKSGQTLNDKLFLVYQTTKLFLLSHAGKHGEKFLKLSKASWYSLYIKGNKQDLLLRLQDLGLLYDIFMNEVYQGAIKEVKSFENIENEIVIWDIGAHVGLASIYFQSSLKGKSLKILAVEPSKQNFSLLKKNLPATKNITHENCAVSNQSKQGYLNESGLAFNNFLTGNGKEDQITSVFSFEDLLKKHPTNKIDIMKIDIEGAEYDFMCNIENWTIKPEIIIIEFHDQEKTKSLIDKIESLDIKLIKV